MIDVIENKLFATSIFQLKLPNYGLFNRDFTDYIYKLKDKDPIGNPRSNYGGWHSKNLNFNDKVVSDFCTNVDPVLINLGEVLNWDMKNYILAFQETWSIINKKGDFNQAHRHGNSILSLVYYVKFPKQENIEDGSIYFQDPRVAGISRKPIMETPKTREDAAKNKFYSGQTHSSGQHIHLPQEGDILIFPGWLEHGVYPNTSNEDRIIISANINFFPKELENSKKLIHKSDIYT
jgi:uncharacterized protein (TIGR02466 family)